ncbi:YifB family Mg chelatase-like AAA ATPase [bacterium]|nr:YifB family Mg chelatase-like AAA ATPase [bacterium]
MSIIKNWSATLQGLQATLIEVEADRMQGKPALTIIGLAEKAVEEAKERIANALSNCGLRLKCKKTVVNLAPADLRKTSSNLELAIAVSLWELTQEEKIADEKDLFLGELSLDGKLRAVRGALPLVNFARERGFKRVFLPKSNQSEVQIVDGIEIYPVATLQEVLDFLQKKARLAPLSPVPYLPGEAKVKVDFADIIGQKVAKRCLEIAAAGGHNLLLTGVPGAGKSLLASSLPSILPPLTREEALEITTIYSICGLLDQQGLIKTRPCRSPHHTISAVGLAGGGSKLLPGEISLAHHGVLFLDELGEFRRDALEILRQPLETGQISIARATGHVIYPAEVTLVAATNPCPCGYLGSKKRACICSQAEIERYRHKLSGPILDRLDMQIFVPEVEVSELTAKREITTARQQKETSAAVRARVVRARARQRARWQALGLQTNQQLSSYQVRQQLQIEKGAQELLTKAMERWQLSARSYFKLIKVARTIADLEEEEKPIIEAKHVAEALTYRQSERK